MKVMPIRYVADMSASARFYGALGLAAGDQSRSGNWIEGMAVQVNATDRALYVAARAAARRRPA